MNGKVHVICPNRNCKQIAEVNENQRGHMLNCEHCQTTFRVPVHHPNQTYPTKPEPALR